MPYEMQPSNQQSRPAGAMEFNLKVKKGSRQKSTVVKQEILSPQENPVISSQDKHEIESPFGQPYLDQHHESRQRAGDKLKLPPKSSKSFQEPWIGGKVSGDDELVKHMTNLPGYLQRAEKGENLQKKALNFGVLEWERLEKWKHEKAPPRGYTDASSSGGISSFKAGGSLTLSSTVQSKSPVSRKKLPRSRCPHANPSNEESFNEDVKQFQAKVVQHDFVTTPSSTLDRQQNTNQKDKCSVRNHSERKLKAGKRKEFSKTITSEKETSLSGLRKHALSQPTKEVKSEQSSVITNRVKEVHASEYYLGRKHCPAKQSSIVLLLPQHSPTLSCSEILWTSEPRTSFDGKPMEANRESFSSDFSSEVLSADLCSELPHSCPLPIGVDTSSDFGVRLHGLANTQKMVLPNDGSCTFPCLDEKPVMVSQGKYINENASSAKPTTENGFGTSSRLDDETTAVKGGHSSPNRRFWFNLGKISRSLSFKERSAVPQFNATCARRESGSVGSEASDCFSQEPCSADFYSETLHTCSPVGVETTTDSDMWRSQLPGVQRMKLTCDGSSVFICPNETLNIPSSAKEIRTAKQLDQEDTELEAVKGRHPSSNPRLSFSLGRMSRSLSFKEGSTAPRFSPTHASVKSVPASSEVSYPLGDANRNKANLHSRARSSPLRRLLDPLFKARVTNPYHSAETNQSFTGNSNSNSKVVHRTESLLDKKHDSSTVEALLQLTTKSGLPLFKIVGDNKNDILIATKKLTASGKDDADWIYTFYSVREIKKKSGSWIRQGHKEKNYGFGYNLIGQMKVSSSHYPDLTGQRSKPQFAVTESVLYSVDLGQTDQEATELVPNKELAAVVVKIPIENSRGDGDQRGNGEELSTKGSMESSQDDRNLCEEGANSTTVVLPLGVHGLPTKGVPSPLIDRWKSGGSCDCGGWDVGCKLQILTNEDQSCKLPGSSKSCSNADRLYLFNQGGPRDNSPIFSLVPFKKGIYTVEFSASFSLLQAFSICVALISGQKSFDFFEGGDNPSEEKLLQESALMGCERMWTPNNVRGEVPTKYAPSPPASPVGRV